MLPDLATFRVLFPEFSTVPDATVQVYLSENGGGFSTTAWGRCYAKAVLYYTAHELSLSLNRQASSTGGVVSQTGVLLSGHEEGIAFAFAPMSASGATAQWLAQTPYGQAYAALQRQCLAKAMLSW